MSLYGAELDVLPALDHAIRKKVEKVSHESGWVDFAEISGLAYSDSYIYSLLRKLEARELVAIREEYLGLGYMMAPTRLWKYSITEKGYRFVYQFGSLRRGKI